jgi:hypothetical protein
MLRNSAPYGRCARPWTTRWVAHRRLPGYSHLHAWGYSKTGGKPPDEGYAISNTQGLVSHT